jgi:hypothetical protein
MTWETWRAARRKSFERWKVISEVTELLNKWRDFDDDEYRQEAVRVLTDPRRWNNG